MGGSGRLPQSLHGFLQRMETRVHWMNMLAGGLCEEQALRHGWRAVWDAKQGFVREAAPSSNTDGLPRSM
mgnify:CR=1 FL=1